MVARQTKVNIWYDTAAQSYRMTVPYNEAFNAMLKGAIPWDYRSWDAENKIWTFSEQYFDAMVKICHHIWGQTNVSVITKDQAQKATAGAVSPSAPLETALAQFMRLIPFDAANAAYRKAAMLLHPDRGGNMEQMSLLNGLWDRISKELYKQ